MSPCVVDIFSYYHNARKQRLRRHCASFPPRHSFSLFCAAADVSCENMRHLPQMWAANPAVSLFLAIWLGNFVLGKGQNAGRPRSATRPKPSGKTAFFSQNARLYGLARKMVQTEQPLKRRLRGIRGRPIPRDTNYFLQIIP